MENRITRSTAHSLEEWVKLYEGKTQSECQIPEGFSLFYLPDRGFATYKVFNDIMIIYAVCGDAKFWRDFAEVWATAFGLKCLCTLCTRKIKPYLRFWGWEILDKTDDEYPRYTCRDNQGRKVVASYKCHDKDDPIYFVTQYLKEMI